MAMAACAGMKWWGKKLTDTKKRSGGLKLEIIPSGFFFFEGGCGFLGVLCKKLFSGFLFLCFHQFQGACCFRLACCFGLLLVTCLCSCSKVNNDWFISSPLLTFLP